MNSLVPCGNRFERPMLWRISTASFDAGRKPKRRSPARSPRSLCCLGLSPLARFNYGRRSFSTDLGTHPGDAREVRNRASFSLPVSNPGFQGECLRRREGRAAVRRGLERAFPGCEVMGERSRRGSLACLLFIHPRAPNLISLRSVLPQLSVGGWEPGVLEPGVSPARSPNASRLRSPPDAMTTDVSARLARPPSAASTGTLITRFAIRTFRWKPSR